MILKLKNTRKFKDDLWKTVTFLFKLYKDHLICAISEYGITFSGDSG